MMVAFHRRISFTSSDSHTGIGSEQLVHLQTSSRSNLDTVQEEGCDRTKVPNQQYLGCTAADTATDTTAHRLRSYICPGIASQHRCFHKTLVQRAYPGLVCMGADMETAKAQEVAEDIREAPVSVLAFVAYTVGLLGTSCQRSALRPSGCTTTRRGLCYLSPHCPHTHTG